MIYESQTFRLEADDQILTLWLDFRGRTNHTFNLPILHELNLVLDRVASLPAPDVFLVRSSRPGVFLEEFGSTELARFQSPLEFAALARRGQEACRKIAALPFPTVALIEGRCAGAGLELALACDRRWVVAVPEASFDLVEGDRGLIPSWGGTYRLPKLVGKKEAAELWREGGVRPIAAKRVGLVDEVIRPSETAVRLLTLIDRTREGKPRASIRRLVRRFFVRLLNPIASLKSPPITDESASGTTSEAELRRAVTAGLSSEGEGLSAERAGFTRLATSEATRRRLELHAHARGTARPFAEPVGVIERLPRRIGIVGGGDLGSHLAVQLRRRGHEVVVQEENANGIDRASRRIRERQREQTFAGTQPDASDICVTSEWIGFENTDLAIEAAAEDPGVKRNLFHELERRVRPRVPLLTASTTISVETIQSEVLRPGRVAGLHLPNPDDRQPVAELVAGPQTDPGLIATLTSWVRSWGFIPARVADRPGRLVELVRLAYLSEGVGLIAEGLPTAGIDAGCRRFGMARGPLQWCDDIGLDRLAERTAQLQLARGDNYSRNLLFQRLIQIGCLGREVGEGFYRYGFTQRPSQITRMIQWQDLDEDAPAPYVFDPESALREGIERIVLRTVNEAAAALSDEPDADPATVDVALAFGMGWALAHGGPLRYADSLGLANVVERLASFAERFGSRYRPCDELIRRAEAGESFYGQPAETGRTAPALRIAG
ncbi:MAG TPA: 3-hydroxyacyl-CoA dehydrogenase NAD-binding domain-containing protein [Gemmataceae bacterium]|jgi:3-hydroxyacyl-CoA dehydrogenase/enoyl-CoA hydratase/3-hydroxybutyryl-CoA epimerase|nr:3-hydroxyacyl-CoA dehydrogenase NAD-binding domain-containing protein [Gemmataceae bacterium]